MRLRIPWCLLAAAAAVLPLALADVVAQDIVAFDRLEAQRPRVFAVPAGEPVSDVTITGEADTTTTTTTTTTSTSTEPPTTTTATATATTTTVTVDTTTKPVTVTEEHTTTTSTLVSTTSTSTVTTTSTFSAGATFIATVTNMHTAVTTATVVLTNTNAGQSVCPTQQPCLFSGGPGMVTVTESETTTAVVTEIANHGETLGVTLVSYSNPGVSVVIVTVTSTDPQQTVTKTVTAEASTETVVATVTQTSIELDEKSQDDVILSYLDTTVVETVMVSIESPSDAAGSPPNGWMTALIVVVVLAVLIMLAVVGYIYYRWRAKKRAEHNATTVRALRQHSAYFDPVTK